MKITIHFLVLVTLVLLTPFFTNAQSNYEDVVYLKNGSVIHGTIIEQVPNESIKIQTADKNIFVYKIDEIQKITKEEIEATNHNHESRRERMHHDVPRSGYTNITELSFGRSLTTRSSTYTISGYTYYDDTHTDEINNNPSFGVQTINGYKFSPYVSAGIGIGINTYSELVLVPVFAAVRANLLEKRVTPFLALDAGYAYSRYQLTGLKETTDDKGGVYVCPAVGVKFNVAPVMALNLSLGLRYQEILVNVARDSSYPYYSGYVDQYRNTSFRMLNVKFGFTFR